MLIVFKHFICNLFKFVFFKIVIFVFLQGCNWLIGATNAPLDDYFWRNTVKKKSSKKNFINFLLLIFFSKICHFLEVFQVHLQVILLFKSSGYKSFYITFENPNINEIISYFRHL